MKSQKYKLNSVEKHTFAITRSNDNGAVSNKYIQVSKFVHMTLMLKPFPV